jgi:hypothetical protein
MRPSPGFIVIVLVMTAFPLLMYMLPSERNIILLWGAAMLILSSIAGNEISGSLSRTGALVWLIGDAALLGALGLTGLLGLSPVTVLSYKLGLLAAIIVGLNLPATALHAVVRRERRRGSNRDL